MEIAGIDATSIVDQLMEIERIPLIQLEARKADANDAATAIAKLQSKVDAYRMAAERLQTPATFDRYTSSVSDPSLVAASVTGDANIGTLTFTVDRLAQSHGLRSIGTVASDSLAVTTDAHLAVAAGTGAIGVATVRAGAGLAAGSFQLEVTQASAAATVSGSALAASTSITAGVDDTIAVEIDGTAHTLTLAAGTYDAAGFASAVQDALDAAGAAATASVGTGGGLRITTTREGSDASVEITGGTALGAAGLTVDTSPHVGTDGVFEIDGTTTTVTSIEPGGSVAVDTGSGTLDVTLSGGLRVGESKVAVVSTGDRSLADVVEAISGANAGVSAAAVQVSTGSWRLQLSATTTGVAGEIAIDPDALSGIGGLVESSAARNARITIGSGAGAYSVESSSNTFSTVLGGVSITAKQASTTAVSVDVARDDGALVTDVTNLVTKANELLAEIKVQTRTDPEARTSGALAGNATIRALAEQVRDALTRQVTGTDLLLPSSVGIERDREGGITLDSAKLRAALEDDPGAVARLFARGGTDSGDVTFAAAAAVTTTGSYDVVVTTPATRATAPTLFGGGVPADTRIGVRIGTTTATVDVGVGDTATQIIDALNVAFAEAGLDVLAESDGAGVRIRAQEWGSAGDFELNADVLGVGTWDAVAGSDVAGAIDGVDATGVGRVLSLTQFADSNAAGLSVEVADGVTGVLGAVEYHPGIAGRVVELATFLTDEDSGPLTTAEQAEERRVEDFNDQIERFEDRLAVREANMRRQWAALQTLLSELQSQGDWLAGQLATLPKNWAPTN